MHDRHVLDSGFGHVLVVAAGLSGLMVLGLLHPSEIGTSLVGVGLGALAAGFGLRGHSRDERERQVHAGG